MSAPDIVPDLSDTDAHAAMCFAKHAFAVRRLQADDGPDGRVVPAETAHHNGAVTIGSVDAPAARGSRGHHIVVGIVDVHHAGAAGADADIVCVPEDTGFDTRRYHARDPDWRRRPENMRRAVAAGRPA